MRLKIRILPKNELEKVSLIILLIIFAVVLEFFSICYSKAIVFSQGETELVQKPAPKEDIDPKIKEFGLKIEKLNILVPIIKDVNGENKTAYNKALNDGVAHYKGTALPGQNSNIFIFGHSSTIFNKGNYATIFASLNDLEKGDEAQIFYQNQIYSYKVSAKEIVEKTDIEVLNPTKKERLTLMTCWPVGTNSKRLVVKFNLNETLSQKNQ